MYLGTCVFSFSKLILRYILYFLMAVASFSFVEIKSAKCPQCLL